MVIDDFEFSDVAWEWKNSWLIDETMDYENNGFDMMRVI